MQNADDLYLAVLYLPKKHQVRLYLGYSVAISNMPEIASHFEIFSDILDLVKDQVVVSVSLLRWPVFCCINPDLVYIN